MKIAIVIIITALFFCSGITYAQDINVELSLESREYSIGDWIPITITAQHDSNITVYPPEPGEKIGELYFIGREDLSAVTADHRQTDRWMLTVSAYDTGYFSIPQIPIAYITETDTSVYTTYTDSAWVFIVSAGGDTLSDIHDIIPPLGIKRAFEDYLPYLIILIILILLGLGYWAYKKYLYKPSEIESVSIKHEVDPYDHAMKRMVELKNKQLWQKGFLKDHYAEITEIVKEYIEQEYRFNALEMTTEEFIKTNAEMQIATDSIVSEFLGDADLVKFAKFIPQPEDCENSIEEAYSILKEARTNARRTVADNTVTDMTNSLDKTDKTDDLNVNRIDDNS